MRKKKWLSALAAAAMMLMLIPISAFAQEVAPENTYDSISEYTAAVSTGELDGEDVYVTIDGKNFTEQDGFVVANTQNKENPPKFHLILTGCTFNDAVVSLGSQGKNTGGAASPSTGAFPITIQNNKTDVEVEQAYMAAESEDIPSVTLEAGELLVKDADDTEVHTPVKVEAKAPTATKPGNIEYWYCTTCGKCYTDAALTQEIPESETIIAATGEEPSDPSTEDPTTDPEETPSTKPEENPDDTANSNPDSSSSTTPPRTGDNSNMAIWFVLLLASAGLAGTTFVVKKRSVR